MEKLMKKKIEDFTVKDAFELAIQIESQAHERYLDFSRQIGSLTKGDAGDFFATMAVNEAKHAEDLIAKYTELFGAYLPSIHIEDYYEYIESEAPSFDRAESYMSTHAALIVARDSEIKAYTFYKMFSETCQDQVAKKFFIDLMNEEEEHRKMVEAELAKVSDDENPLRNNDDIDEPNGL
jgi:rubrerythrin